MFAVAASGFPGCGGNIVAGTDTAPGDAGASLDGQALSRVGDAARDASTSFPDGKVIEQVADGALVALPGSLASCQWPASLAPRDGGPGVYSVTRTILACGSGAEGASELCPSDDGLSCAGLGGNSQTEPCVLGCAPDQYAVDVQSPALSGQAAYPSALVSSLSMTCAGPDPIVASALDGIAETPAVFCCPCNADAGASPTVAFEVVGKCTPPPSPSGIEGIGTVYAAQGAVGGCTVPTTYTIYAYDGEPMQRQVQGQPAAAIDLRWNTNPDTTLVANELYEALRETYAPSTPGDVDCVAAGHCVIDDQGAGGGTITFTPLRFVLSFSSTVGTVAEASVPIAVRPGITHAVPWP